MQANTPTTVMIVASIVGPLIALGVVCWIFWKARDSE